MRGPRRRGLLWMCATCLVAGLAGCASASDRALRTSLAAIGTSPPPARASSATTSGVPSCANPTASLRPRGPLPPPGRMPGATSMRVIQDRGKLIAGVDQNTLRFAYLNPFNGQLEGFEIDLLREVARAIFGSPDRIEFKAISSAQRVGMVQSRAVDLVADAMTVTCERRRQVAFSTVYYDAGQRVLVPVKLRARGVRDLGGRRVCATKGSTSIAELYRLAPPRPIPVGVDLRTDCLVALQQGAVDAISTDDAILFGLQAQDPYTKIVGPRFTEEPYGIAINQGRADLVRFVNAVLERMRIDGTWAAIYDRWIAPVSHQHPSPPQPHYGD